jgi:hypothetical protein
MEELHTDSIDGGHEASYGARSRARERAYSNITSEFFGVVYSEKQDFPVSLLFNKLYKWLDKVNQN